MTYRVLFTLLYLFSCPIVISFNIEISMTDAKIKAIFVITFEIGCANRDPPMSGKNIEKRNKTHQRLILEFESLKENSFEILVAWLKVQISFMM